MLPTWLMGQIAAARAVEVPDGTAWSVYVSTENGLALAAGAHDRETAQRWLDESGRTGVVGRSPSRMPGN